MSEDILQIHCLNSRRIIQRHLNDCREERRPYVFFTDTMTPTAEGGHTAKRSYSKAVFQITADRFLRNMVRAVVGTLFDIGRGKRKPEDMLDILEQKNRCSAGQSAPAEGLYLVNITY